MTAKTTYTFARNFRFGRKTLALSFSISESLYTRLTGRKMPLAREAQIDADALMLAESRLREAELWAGTRAAHEDDAELLSMPREEALEQLKFIYTAKLVAREFKGA